MKFSELQAAKASFEAYVGDLLRRTPILSHEEIGQIVEAPAWKIYEVAKKLGVRRRGPGVRRDVLVEQIRAELHKRELGEAMERVKKAEAGSR